MYSERSAGFFAALPVRREALFVSLCAAGLLPLLGANLLAFAAALAVEALFGATGIAALGQWLGAVTLMTLCYFGIAVLCDGGQCRPCGQPAAEARQRRSNQRQHPVCGDAAKRQRPAGRQTKAWFFGTLHVQKRRACFARVDRSQALNERFHVHRVLVKQA